MWESWDAIKDDGSIADCSFNHYAFGCVGDFLYRKVLGIQNAGIGYDKILIAPAYMSGLTWVEGSYRSVSGEIKLRWEKCENGEIIISGYIPANTSAEIILPDGTRGCLGNGKFEIKP